MPRSNLLLPLLLRRAAVVQQQHQHARTFTQAARLRTGGGTDSSEHITNSTDTLDGFVAQRGLFVKFIVHSQAAEAGKEDRTTRTSDEGGSQAANQRDDRGNQKRAKEEFPEAPVTIGMNDERGSKGH
ncbi:MAG: hypothetical protein M1816_007836 [Peltula sp. TS41687]|nr:MAG: hypothetical protein M1816_007836 [Peltula sp. TS41687]